MRTTECFDWITRKDLKLGKREALTDYTHLTLTTIIKRHRYLYQCKIQGKEPVK